MSDWTNDVFSKSFAFNLWIEMWKNLSMDEIKTSYHRKCLNDFYSLGAMHQKPTRSFRSLVRFFDASQLVNKNRACVRTFLGIISISSSAWHFTCCPWSPCLPLAPGAPSWPCRQDGRSQRHINRLPTKTNLRPPLLQKGLLCIKEVSFYRNCDDASVGEYNRVI